MRRTRRDAARVPFEYSHPTGTRLFAGAPPSQVPCWSAVCRREADRAGEPDRPFCRAHADGNAFLFGGVGIKCRALEGSEALAGPVLPHWVAGRSSASTSIPPRFFESWRPRCREKHRCELPSAQSPLLFSPL